MASTPFNVGYDTTFELNEFGQPRIRSEIEMIKDVLLFVLFAKPGQYPSLPMIGIDIQSMLYSFYDEINCADLQNQIIEQCAALGTFFSDGTIAIRKTIYRGHPSLLINIQGQESYPSGYLKDSIGNANQYMIGITFDDFNNMVFNINRGGV